MVLPINEKEKKELNIMPSKSFGGKDAIPIPNQNQQRIIALALQTDR